MSETNETSLHDDLAAAFDEVAAKASEAPSGAGDSTSPAPEAPAAQATEAPKGDRPRDEGGRYTKAPKAAAPAATPAPKPAEVGKTPAPAPAQGTGTPAPAAGKPGMAAPPGPATIPTATVGPLTAKAMPANYVPPWGAAGRAEWAKLPPAAQAEVYRRERELKMNFDASTDARRGWEGMSKALQPYEGMLRADAAAQGREYDAGAVVGGLLQVQHALRFGDKAAVVAAIIKGYDVPLEAINSRLGIGEGGTSATPAPQPAQFRDPRFDQYLAQQEAHAAQQQAALEAELKGEIAAFEADPAHEFFADVKPRMIALLKGGLTPDLQTAYDEACWANAEVRAILQQRAEVASAQATLNGATQRTRQTASSVRGESPMVPVEPEPPGDLKAELRRQMAAAEARQR